MYKSWEKHYVNVCCECKRLTDVKNLKMVNGDYYCLDVEQCQMRQVDKEIEDMFYGFDDILYRGGE